MQRNRADKEVPAAALETQRQYSKKVFDLNNINGAAKKALILTYGCQQNVSDSERIKGMLSEMNYDFTEETNEADLIIFNTCAVREHAEQRVFGNVGALKKIKADNPSLVIALCGCMTQQEHIAQKIKTSYPYVDLVFGTHAIHKLPELLYDAITQNKRIFDIEDTEGTIAEGLPVRREGSVKAWLPIMYGCNNFCSYCIVPYVRGRERSRLPEMIIKEAEELIAEGYKEITLLGQNVNSYGKDIGTINFSNLLRQLNELDGDFRIRFMTSHPKDATPELIETMAACEKVSKHLHLPLQSGNNRILKLMNRGYTREHYKELINLAKQLMPEISLTSDIIVGFPGESYAEFCDTLSLIKEVEFDKLFTFIYSKRQGTPAEKLEDTMTHKEKAIWFDELLRAQEDISSRLMRAKVGSIYKVLCEGNSRVEGLLTGRTDSNIIVDFKSGSAQTGDFVDVKITKSFNFMLLGEDINN